MTPIRALWSKHTAWFSRVKTPVRIWLLWWYFNLIFIVYGVYFFERRDYFTEFAKEHGVLQMLYNLWRYHEITWTWHTGYFIVLMGFLYFLSKRVHKGWKQFICLFALQIVLFSVNVLISRIVQYYPYDKNWRDIDFYTLLRYTHRPLYLYPPEKYPPPETRFGDYFRLGVVPWPVDPNTGDVGTYIPTKDDYRRFRIISSLYDARVANLTSVIGVFYFLDSPPRMLYVYHWWHTLD